MSSKQASFLVFLQRSREVLNSVYEHDSWTAMTIMMLLPPLSKQLVLRILTLSSSDQVQVPLDFLEHWVEPQSIPFLQSQLSNLEYLHILYQYPGPPSYIVMNQYFKHAMDPSFSGSAFLLSFSCIHSLL